MLFVAGVLLLSEIRPEKLRFCDNVDESNFSSYKRCGNALLTDVV